MRTPLAALAAFTLFPSLAAGDTVFGEGAHLYAADGEQEDELGWSVDVDGDTVVVGAPGDQTGTFVTGSAYVFARSGSTWSFEAKLTANDAGLGDRFGEAVAVSGDTIVVGAPQQGPSNAGGAYVFVKSFGSWSLQQKLLPSAPNTNDFFGTSVDVDGDTVVVGALLDDEASVFNTGAVYVFTRFFGSWSEQARLVAESPETFDSFGRSVAIRGDTVVVGAEQDNVPGEPSAGAAYVFQRSGGAWSRTSRLLPPDPEQDSDFGHAVAIEPDQGTILVGAPEHGVGGAAYFFVRGTPWVFQDKVTASTTTAGDRFGQSVALAPFMALIGAPEDGVNGRAFEFTPFVPHWFQSGTVFGLANGTDDRVGTSVAVSDDTVVLGGVLGDTPVHDDTGAAYAWRRLGPNGSDDCSLAPRVTGHGPFAFDNLAMGTDGPFLGCVDLPTIYHDIWYRWTAECTTDVTLSTCGQTTLDTGIAVYRGTGCSPFAAELVACNRNGCGTQSMQTFPVEQGVEYLLRIGSGVLFDGGVGTLSLSYDCGLCPAETLTSEARAFPPLEPARWLDRAYRVRDRLFAATSLGRTWTGLYYAHAPRVSAILRERPRLRRRVAALLAVSGPGLEALVEGDARARSVRVPPQAAVLLDQVLRELEEADADGPLAGVLRVERERLGVRTLIGTTWAEAWERLNAR